MTKFSLRLSQISLALVVAFGAVNFTACGEDMSKAPIVEWRSGGGELGIIFKSQDDTTSISKVVIKGSNGECEMDEYFGAGERGGLLYGEKIAYGKSRGIYISTNKCPPKNGAYKVEVATNLGAFKYELKTK